MTKKERALLAIEKLKEIYPEAVCSLTYRHPYELLIATRLSAQCTDARVNIVTEVLFEKYPTLESLANAEFEPVSYTHLDVYKRQDGDLDGFINAYLKAKSLGDL